MNYLNRNRNGQNQYQNFLQEESKKEFKIFNINTC